MNVADAHLPTLPRRGGGSVVVERAPTSTTRAGARVSRARAYKGILHQ